MINKMKLMTHGPARHQDLVFVGVSVTAPVSLRLWWQRSNTHNTHIHTHTNTHTTQYTIPDICHVFDNDDYGVDDVDEVGLWKL